MPIKKLWEMTDPPEDERDEDDVASQTPNVPVWGPVSGTPKAPEPEAEKMPDGLSPEERMEWIVKQIDKDRKPDKGKRALDRMEAKADAEFLRRAEETEKPHGDVDSMAREDTISALTLMKFVLEEDPDMDDLMAELIGLVKERGGRRVITLLAGMIIQLRRQVIQRLGESVGKGAKPIFHIGSKEEFQRKTGIDPSLLFGLNDESDDDPDDDDDEN